MKFSMKIETDRISQNIRDQRAQYNNGHNLSMFLDDLSYSRYDIKDNTVNISVTSPNDALLVSALNEKFPNSDRWRNNLNESILNFFAMISSELIYTGVCAFEKICIKDSSEFIALKLISGKLEFKKDKIIQYVTDESRNNIQVFIPIEKCFIIEFPDEICSTKEYLKILDEMLVIDNKNPMFSILNPSALNKISGYNPMEHNKKLDLILWGITKKISWHHRSQFSKKELFSPYYLTLRDLKFKKTKLILMNHIFKFIEEMIENIFSDTKISIAYIKKYKTLMN